MTTSPTMKRKKRKRTGSAVASAAAMLLCAVAAAPFVFAADRKPAPSAVIAGTVFRETGLSFGGARIAVTGLEKGKKKEWKTFASPRGEFFLRVPPGPADYTLHVTADGYNTYEKTVTFGADERIDLSILMEPAKTGGAKSANGRRNEQR